MTNSKIYLARMEFHEKYLTILANYLAKENISHILNSEIGTFGETYDQSNSILGSKIILFLNKLKKRETSRLAYCSKRKRNLREKIRSLVPPIIIDIYSMVSK